VLPAGVVVVGGRVVVGAAVRVGAAVVVGGGTIVAVTGAPVVVGATGGTVVVGAGVVVTGPAPVGDGTFVRGCVGVAVGRDVVVTGADVVVGGAGVVGAPRCVVVRPGCRGGWVDFVTAADFVVGEMACPMVTAGAAAEVEVLVCPAAEVAAGVGSATADVGPRPFWRPRSPTWSPTSPTAHQAITAITAAQTAHTVACPARLAMPAGSVNITDGLSAADGCGQVKNMTMT
jgi:hypothetical protein